MIWRPPRQPRLNPCRGAGVGWLTQIVARHTQAASRQLITSKISRKVARRKREYARNSVRYDRVAAVNDARGIPWRRMN